MKLKFFIIVLLPFDLALLLRVLIGCLRITCYCSYFDLAGHTPRTISSSPSTESLSGGRDHAMSSPPLPVSRGRDSSTSSPPSSASKKDSFFNISRSRSHSKTINKKDAVSSEFSFCNSCFLFYHLLSRALIFLAIFSSYCMQITIKYYFVLLFVLYFIGAICMLMYMYVFLHTGGAGGPGVILTGSD